MTRQSTIAYTPGLVPVNDQDPGALVRFLREEFISIEAAVNRLAAGHLDIQAVEPVKRSIGDIRYADGVNWNPGEGAGLYLFDGAVWISLLHGPLLRGFVKVNFPVVSSTTPVGVTGTTHLLEAGKRYIIRGKLFTTSDAAGGVKVSLSGTCTATDLNYDIKIEQGATWTVNHLRSSTIDVATGITAVTSATISIDGGIRVNTAGTLGPFFAQNASSGVASTVLQGSFFEVFPILN